jgi:hypothetical protein
MNKNSRRYKEHAAKRGGGGYVALPHAVIRSPEWAELSPFAVKLLLDMLAQYRGDNNGELVAYWSKMSRERRWRSKETLFRALAELRNANWLELTRRGRRNKTPALYAVTFYAIDHCGGKLEEAKATGSPSGAWRRPPTAARRDESNAPDPSEGSAAPAPEAKRVPVTVTYRTPKLSRVRQAYLTDENRYGSRTCEQAATDNRYASRTYSGDFPAPSGTPAVPLSRFTTTPGAEAPESTSGPASAASAHSAPVSAVDAEEEEERRAQYREILREVREAAAKVRPGSRKQLGKAHLLDPFWREVVVLCSRGARNPLKPKAAANALDRLVCKYGWGRVSRIAREAESELLWGLGAFTYIEKYPFSPAAPSSRATNEAPEPTLAPASHPAPFPQGQADAEKSASAAAVIQRCKEKAAKARPGYSPFPEKEHVKTPQWAFMKALLVEGSGKNENWVGAFLGRLSAKYHWFSVYRAVKECESKLLYGTDAIEFLKNYLPETCGEP